MNDKVSVAVLAGLQKSLHDKSSTKDEKYFAKKCRNPRNFNSREFQVNSHAYHIFHRQNNDFVVRGDLVGMVARRIRRIRIGHAGDPC